MSKATDIIPQSAELYFLPIKARTPLKFGHEVVTQVICIRVQMKVSGINGKKASGWGETPLNVQWVWPGGPKYEEKEKALLRLIKTIRHAWSNFQLSGHPMEVGHAFIQTELRGLWHEANSERSAEIAIPWLAALLCCSPFDIALHDAYGVLHQQPTYQTYTADFMNHDLAYYLQAESGISFRGKYPADFLNDKPQEKLLAWHLVGGLDPLSEDELSGKEPRDDYPVLLTDWIRRDGLKCLKIKLRGNDPHYDYHRLVKVGQLAVNENVLWLSADFNCTVQEPAYVDDILDRLQREHSRLYDMLLYIEQPFPYELEQYNIDVHSLAARKPLFMDESAHDWQHVRLGRRLGWNGVALKTCKTQTGALLSLCWAKAHDMRLMVQDLSNPMLAQISHVLLAVNAGTIMGVESNGMQFFPEASMAEAAVHPLLYKRSNGSLDLSSLGKTGFGYRVDEISRDLTAFKQ